MPQRSMKKRINTYRTLDSSTRVEENPKVGISSNDRYAYHNQALYDEEERANIELQRQKYKKLAESRQEGRLAEILRLQEDFQKQKESVEIVQHKIEDENIAANSVGNEEETTAHDSDSEQSSEGGYPSSIGNGHSRFSWIESITSSLNSSFTSQSRLITDISHSEELKVEGRIKTEELVLKVHEALKQIQQKPLQKTEQSQKHEQNKRNCRLELPDNKMALAQTPPAAPGDKAGILSGLKKLSSNLKRSNDNPDPAAEEETFTRREANVHPPPAIDTAADTGPNVSPRPTAMSFNTNDELERSPGDLQSSPGDLENSPGDLENSPDDLELQILQQTLHQQNEGKVTELHNTSDENSGVSSKDKPEQSRTKLTKAKKKRNCCSIS